MQFDFSFSEVLSTSVYLVMVRRFTFSPHYKVLFSTFCWSSSEESGRIAELAVLCVCGSGYDDRWRLMISTMEFSWLDSGWFRWIQVVLKVWISNANSGSHFSFRLTQRQTVQGIDRVSLDLIVDRLRGRPLEQVSPSGRLARCGQDGYLICGSFERILVFSRSDVIMKEEQSKETNLSGSVLLSPALSSFVLLWISTVKQIVSDNKNEFRITSKSLHDVGESSYAQLVGILPRKAVIIWVQLAAELPLDLVLSTLVVVGRDRHEKQERNQREVDFKHFRLLQLAHTERQWWLRMTMVNYERKKLHKLVNWEPKGLRRWKNENSKILRRLWLLEAFRSSDTNRGRPTDIYTGCKYRCACLRL